MDNNECIKLSADIVHFTSRIIKELIPDFDCLGGEMPINKDYIINMISYIEATLKNFKNELNNEE